MKFFRVFCIQTRVIDFGCGAFFGRKLGGTLLDAEFREWTPPHPLGPISRNRKPKQETENRPKTESFCFTKPKPKPRNRKRKWIENRNQNSISVSLTSKPGQKTENFGKITDQLSRCSKTSKMFENWPNLIGFVAKHHHQAVMSRATPALTTRSMKTHAKYLMKHTVGCIRYGTSADTFQFIRTDRTADDFAFASHCRLLTRHVCKLSTTAHLCWPQIILNICQFRQKIPIEIDRFSRKVGRNQLSFSRSVWNICILQKFAVKLQLSPW